MSPGVHVITHPLIQVKLTRMRAAETLPVEFRARLSEVAELLVFEATRDIDTQVLRVNTPVAPHDGAALARPIVVVPILRAGLGMVDGMLHLLPDASVGHIGMFRDEDTHRPQSYYCKLPPHVNESDVLVVDPMLATGHSATAAITQLKEYGPKSIRFVCCVSCPEGLKQLSEAHPDVPIYTAAVDGGLNEKAYIVPGLGDAGDRYFGTV